MSFEFDTGAQHRPNSAEDGLNDAWCDAVQDAAGGPDAPRDRFLRAASAQIINDIWDHKSTDGVRRMFWKRQEILFEMSMSEPSAHDDVLENLHERLSLLKEKSAPAVKASAPLNVRTKPTNQTKEVTYNGF